jgi:hypothetical protein
MPAPMIGRVSVIDGREVLRRMQLVERDGILVPRGVIPDELEATCPAASITRFGNTGRPAVKCGIADDAMAVDDNPVGVLGWCCGGYESCPVWVAEKDSDPAVARQRVARAVSKRRQVTEAQIRSGMRFDDAGVGRSDLERAIERERGRDPERDAAAISAIFRDFRG